MIMIYICCAGGATSSLFCENIQKSAIKSDVMIDSIFNILNDVEASTKNHSVILAYGPAGFLTPDTIKAHHLDTILKGIWIAPQMRFMTNRIRKDFEDMDIPVESIDMHTFGMMDGKQAIRDIKRLFLSKK